MIGLDTNVLVRYIVQDHPQQSARAAAFIESQCTADDPGRIDSIVLCELVWVLESAYGYQRDTVATVLRRILETAELITEDPAYAWTALRAYASGPADFADYFIGLRNHERGCKTTWTFDEKAAGSRWHHAIP